MALEGGVRRAALSGSVPQIAEFISGNTSPPQMRAVFNGVPTQNPLLSIVIKFLSDDLTFFIRLAFLLLTVDGNRVEFARGHIGSPDHVVAPNHP
jgi:hypothetical protein